jgi:hypothetical protein
MKKTVTDILWLGDAPVSFNQISFKGSKYEGVCPWCAENLGKVRASTYGELCSKLFPIQADHMDTCKEKESTEIKVVMKRKMML